VQATLWTFFTGVIILAYQCQGLLVTASQSRIALTCSSRASGHGEPVAHRAHMLVSCQPHCRSGSYQSQDLLVTASQSRIALTGSSRDLGCAPVFRPPETVRYALDQVRHALSIYPWHNKGFKVCGSVKRHRAVRLALDMAWCGRSCWLCVELCALVVASLHHLSHRKHERSEFDDALIDYDA